MESLAFARHRIEGDQAQTRRPAECLNAVRDLQFIVDIGKMKVHHIS